MTAELCAVTALFPCDYDTSLPGIPSPQTQQAQHQHTMPCDTSAEKCCLAQVDDKPTHKPASRNLYHNKGLNSKEQYTLQGTHSKDVDLQRSRERHQQLETLMRMRGDPGSGLTHSAFQQEDPEIHLTSLVHCSQKKKPG